jgi:hypothetical protein
METIEMYINRDELKHLSSHQKALLARYCRMFWIDYPVGRKLANALMCLNSRYDYEFVSQKFINWLYYY